MPITQLRCNYVDFPLGIDRAPYFTYVCEDFSPVSYYAEIYDGSYPQAALWTSPVYGSEACGISCSARLKDRTLYAYRIFARDAAGILHRSNYGYFETSFMEKALPEAQWVVTETCDAPVFFIKFHCDDVSASRLYLACRGFCHAYLNGRPVSCDEMSPVWSDYHERPLTKMNYPFHDFVSYSQYYNTYDTTQLVQPGENILAVWVGNGFYHQYANQVEGEMTYGMPSVKFSLYMKTSVGEQAVHSGATTYWSESPLQFTNVYLGEKYDGRVSLEECLMGRAESRQALIGPEYDTVMRSQLCPADHIVQLLPPRLVAHTDEGDIFDVGANISGRVRVFTSAASGESVTMQFAENLTPDNQALDAESSGGCWKRFQIDTYYANGAPNQEFAPYFCLHGFRYFRITGSYDRLLCEVIHTDVKQEGSLSTSNPVLNRLVEAYCRSQLTNMHNGVPSDCPHRERLGYTGDGQLTADTAAYFFDLPAFYQKWMQDIIDGQCKISGHVQHTAPFAGGGGGPSAWGGAIIFVPWKIYQQYGNIAMLSDYYPQMLRWMGYIKARSTDGILDREEEGGWCLGDWCPPGGLQITPDYVNTCLVVHQWELLIKIAKALGRDGDAERFATEAEATRDALKRHFYNEETGVWDKGLQGADAFAWSAGLLTDNEARERLQSYKDGHFDTGIVGTPLLAEALFQLGLEDIAMHLLTITDYPSFGYMFECGATTLWEYFEKNMHSSHNHPMFGAVVGVLIRRLAGIRQEEGCAGYQKVILAPCLSSGLSSLSCTIPTPRGTLSLQWVQRPDGTIFVSVKLPWACQGILELPGVSYTVDGGKEFCALVRPEDFTRA